MNSHHKYLLYVVLTFSLHCLNAQSNGDPVMKRDNETVEVRVEIAQALKKIDQDAAYLKCLMKAFFQSVGKKELDKGNLRPSDIFKFFSTTQKETILVDKQINLPLSYYFSNVFSSYYLQCDKDFKEYRKTHSHEQTWQWFDEYFEKHVLISGICCQKKMFVQQDLERREFEKKVFFLNW